MPRYIKLLIRKNGIMRFFTGFFPFPLQPRFFLSSNKKIYLLMFFQAVKFLLACIFLENESIFHFIFFSRKVTLSLLQGCPWTEHTPHTTLKKTDSRPLRKWEPGSFWTYFGRAREWNYLWNDFSPPYLPSKKKIEVERNLTIPLFTLKPKILHENNSHGSGSDDLH